MGGILSLLSGPISALLQSAGEIIGKFVTDPGERLKAQLELQRLQMDFQLKLVEADGAFAAQQASVITSEAKSESWLARNWRPILMLVFTYVIAHNYIISPIFGIASVAVPPEMWNLLQLGVTGYIVGRSVEKVAPRIAQTVVQAKGQAAGRP